MYSLRGLLPGLCVTFCAISSWPGLAAEVPASPPAVNVPQGMYVPGRHPHGIGDLTGSQGAEDAPQDVLADPGIQARSLADSDPAPTSAGPGATGRFVAWTDGRLYDPNGNEFILRGVNIFPSQASARDTDALVNCWKFNSVRVLFNSKIFTIDQVRNAIRSYRARGLVVIVSQMVKEFGGYLEPVEMARVKKFLTTLAAENVNDPYVWFAAYSEWGGSSDMIKVNGRHGWNQTNVRLWISQARELISAIRATGNKNPIPVAGMVWGQDILRFKRTSQFDQPITEISSILAFGDQIAQGNTNIIWDQHSYRPFDDPSYLKYLLAYIDALAAQGKALLFLEHGSHLPAGGAFDMDSTNNLYAARAAGRHFGNAPWHWSHNADARGRHNLTLPASGGSGADINDCRNPSNLSEFGRKVWDDTHGVP